MRISSRPFATLALAALLAAGGPRSVAAERLTYFNGPGQIGFDNSSAGLPPLFLIESQAGLAGLRVKQNVKKIKKVGDAFEVSLKLKIQNKGSETREDLLVLLSALARPGAVAPGSEIELDLDGRKQKLPLEIVMLDDPTFERFFAGLAIGDLAPGKKFKTNLTYRVLGDLDTRNPSILTLTAGASSTVIPEPASALLLGLGLASLGIRYRRRRPGRRA